MRQGARVHLQAWRETGMRVKAAVLYYLMPLGCGTSFGQEPVS